MLKPKVFASPINKKINNSQEVFYEHDGIRNEVRYSYNDIIKKINDIFNSSHHVYKSKVSITTKDNYFNCDIVGKTSNSLLTLEGDLIRISDILDIKKI